MRSDNIAFVDGGAVFVDWNWASRGNAELDLVAWLPSLRAEGGPEPDTLYSGAPELIALVAGVWAS
ncbi:MAG: aminoglycoside phosphotransferase family protein, partial [Actinomycetota bacterium]|nr:aminoglycoside phosphotransferase family protein [Actinomycetota bacterium]